MKDSEAGRTSYFSPGHLCTCDGKFPVWGPGGDQFRLGLFSMWDI